MSFIGQGRLPLPSHHFSRKEKEEAFACYTVLCGHSKQGEDLGKRLEWGCVTQAAASAPWVLCCSQSLSCNLLRTFSSLVFQTLQEVLEKEEVDVHMEYPVIFHETMF